MYSEAVYDYIEYFMWRHENQLTAKEIADRLGISVYSVYSMSKSHGIQVKNRAQAKEADCKNRPAACFSCPAIDCRCRGKMNEEEMEYVALSK